MRTIRNLAGAVFVTVFLVSGGTPLHADYECGSVSTEQRTGYCHYEVDCEWTGLGDEYFCETHEANPPLAYLGFLCQTMADPASALGFVQDWSITSVYYDPMCSGPEPTTTDGQFTCEWDVYEPEECPE